MHLRDRLTEWNGVIALIGLCVLLLGIALSGVWYTYTYKFKVDTLERTVNQLVAARTGSDASAGQISGIQDQIADIHSSIEILDTNDTTISEEIGKARSLIAELQNTVAGMSSPNPMQERCADLMAKAQEYQRFGGSSVVVQRSGGVTEPERNPHQEQYIAFECGKLFGSSN